MLDLRIDGGTVATLHGEPRPQSVGIIGEHIVAVGDLGDAPARETLDASGRLVIPGAIDPHVHLGFTDLEEEWETESRLAVVGGVTTALVYFRTPEPYDALLAEFIEQGEARSHVDFGVHLGMLHDDHLSRLDDLADRFGLRSLKMYTTYKSGELAAAGVLGQDDGFILDVMRRAAARGLVVNVHCENDDIVKRAERLYGDGVDDPALRWSAMRPPVAEVEAIRRVGLFARESGATLYVPHVSSEQALAAAREERALGTDIRIETCTQYLASRVASARGMLAKVNPPVRPEQDGEELWAGIRDGTVDTIGTDHACLMRADKTGDQVEGVRPGFPGLGTLVPILMDGVANGRMSPADYVRCNLRAAEIFDLPRHGAIAPGYRADVVVVDLEARRAVDPARLGGYSDFSPFEGEPLSGWPVATVLRGVVVAREGELTSAPTGGYVRRQYEQSEPSAQRSPAGA